MNRIIQAEFEGYIEHVYPGLAPGSDQYEHLRGAFFGGALIALNHANNCRHDRMAMMSELNGFDADAPIANRVIGGEAS
jgi:hypothetical protein